MQRVIKILFLVFAVGFANGQERLTLKTKYKIKNKYGPNHVQKEIKRLKDVETKIERTIEEKFKIKDSITGKVEDTVVINKITVTEKTSMESKEGKKCTECPNEAKAFLKLQEDKLYVNYYLNNRNVKQDSTYYFNSLGIGTFIGWDQAMGRGTNIWDYDGAFWFGLSLGIDIFKFGKVPD
ncbi:hypothetical protein [Flagellimonas sp. CMM7]|uniref:hypothetical protein n=1 Tax=Flagellimonas sp. CMM7 TaxID=2654676 RepID=UPI0013D74936|nr:hypothetical protein [Flagellimonas sp. CMM7]UII81079.1 hypothetical protein LV704_06075 [Flagellimonas sp. CMM7]